MHNQSYTAKASHTLLAGIKVWNKVALVWDILAKDGLTLLTEQEMVLGPDELLFWREHHLQVIVQAHIQSMWHNKGEGHMPRSLLCHKDCIWDIAWVGKYNN